MSDPFEGLAFTGDDVAEALKVDTRGDTRICSCGHPAGAHVSVTMGKSASAEVLAHMKESCIPSKMQCPCAGFKPVVQAQNARRFIRKTRGPGAEHALAMGMKASVDAGETVEWLVPLVCGRCGGKDRINIMPISEHGVVMMEPSPLTVFACATCQVSLNSQ